MRCCSQLSQDDFSNEGFPFGTAREMRIGYQSALAMRLTYVGELGWELYIPTPFALPVYDALIAAGAAFGLATAAITHDQLAAYRKGLSRLVARHRAR